MSELVTNRIHASATKLGLPHLAKTLQELTGRADTESMGYLEFLDLVLQEELAVRDERRFRAGLRLSKLPHHKTLDDYDFSFQPDLDPRKVRDLATLAFVQAKANVAFLGPPGPYPDTRDAHVAELTGLNARLAGWTGALRLLVRRVKPSARHVKNLTEMEKRTGWRCSHSQPRPNRANVTGKIGGWKQALTSLAMYYGEEGQWKLRRRSPPHTHRSGHSL